MNCGIAELPGIAGIAPKLHEVLGHLRDLVQGYLSRREDLMALAGVIAAKRAEKAPAEAEAARILLGRIKNERLG